MCKRSPLPGKKYASLFLLFLIGIGMSSCLSDDDDGKNNTEYTISGTAFRGWSDEPLNQSKLTFYVSYKEFVNQRTEEIGEVWTDSDGNFEFTYRHFDGTVPNEEGYGIWIEMPVVSGPRYEDIPVNEDIQGLQLPETNFGLINLSLKADEALASEDTLYLYNGSVLEGLTNFKKVIQLDPSRSTFYFAVPGDSLTMSTDHSLKAGLAQNEVLDTKGRSYFAWSFDRDHFFQAVLGIGDGVPTELETDTVFSDIERLPAINDVTLSVHLD